MTNSAYMNSMLFFWHAHMLLLGMFYWMLLNIHPAHRSTLHCIQLLAVAKSNDIRVYGIDTVLAPAVADLKVLAKDVSNVVCIVNG